MSGNQSINVKIQELAKAYDQWGAQAPTLAQWRAIAERPATQPLTLINFFKFRQQAKYSGRLFSSSKGQTGQEAFGQYAAVSMPAMEVAGGSFLHVAPVAGVFVGPSEDWDMVAIGHYPDLAAFYALYENREYQAAYGHRVAACERQKVVVCD